MSLMDEVGGGLDGLSQLRVLMASGRKPGIIIALDFEVVEVESRQGCFCRHAGGTCLQSDRHGAWRLCRDAARFRLRLRRAFLSHGNAGLYDVGAEDRLSQADYQRHRTLTRREQLAFVRS